MRRIIQLVVVLAACAEAGPVTTDGTLAPAVALMTTFFKTSPFTQCWFMAGRTCPL